MKSCKPLSMFCLSALITCIGSVPLLADEQPIGHGNVPNLQALKYKKTSPNGQLIVGFHQDGWDEVISIRNAKTGKEIKRIVGHGDTPTAFNFTRDGKFLASSCPRNGFALWDVSTGKKLLRIPAQQVRARDKVRNPSTPVKSAKPSNENSPDPALIELRDQLKIGTGKYNEVPSIVIDPQSNGNSLTLRYKTRKYMVYRSDKTGRMGSKLFEQEGPDNEGVLLNVHVQKKGDVNQAVVPQTLKRPYWLSDLNIYPVKNSDKQLYVALSYRNRTDKKLINKIKTILAAITLPAAE